MKNLTKAIKELTRVIGQSVPLLREIIRLQNKKANLTARRKEALAGAPYTEAQLIEMLRTELVMVASQLKVGNTSIPKPQLIEAVLDVQDRRQAGQPRQP